MSMNRRDFLKRLAAATAAATAVAALDLEGADIERILWTPGEKKIFLPPEGGWTPKEIVTEWTEQEFNRWSSQRLVPIGQGYVQMPDGKTHWVASSAYTGMGTADFDAHGNLLRLGGRLITSAEDHTAAECAAYQRYSHGRSEQGVNYQMRLAQNIARRKNAGVYDAPSFRRRGYGEFDWRG